MLDVIKHSTTIEAKEKVVTVASVEADGRGLESQMQAGQSVLSAPSAGSVNESLHMSLSRTLPLKFHLVESLLEELRNGLSKCAG